MSRADILWWLTFGVNLFLIGCNALLLWRVRRMGRQYEHMLTDMRVQSAMMRAHLQRYDRAREEVAHPEVTPR